MIQTTSKKEIGFGKAMEMISEILIDLKDSEMAWVLTNALVRMSQW